MNILEAIAERHSVRRYTEQPIEGEILSELQNEIETCNAESGMRFQLIVNEPKAFASLLARYGHFTGVRNYIALVGEKRPDGEEICGYYGERIVLKAQMLGLRTCWAARTYAKIPGTFTVNKGEKLYCMIAVGYGENDGTEHRSKPISELCRIKGSVPDWFYPGMEAAVKAPTAMNQQKFMIGLDHGNVKATAGRGIHSKMDLGIVKYHFEQGAQRKIDWK